MRKEIVDIIGLLHLFYSFAGETLCVLVLYEIRDGLFLCVIFSPPTLRRMLVSGSSYLAYPLDRFFNRGDISIAAYT